MKLTRALPLLVNDCACSQYMAHLSLGAILMLLWRQYSYVEFMFLKLEVDKWDIRGRRTINIQGPGAITLVTNLSEMLMLVILSAQSFWHFTQNLLIFLLRLFIHIFFGSRTFSVLSSNLVSLFNWQSCMYKQYDTFPYSRTKDRAGRNEVSHYLSQTSMYSYNIKIRILMDLVKYNTISICNI